MSGVFGVLLLGGLWSVVVGAAANRLVWRVAVRVPESAASQVLRGAALLGLIGRVKATVGRLDRLVGAVTVRDQRLVRQRDRTVTEQLPDVVDLLRLAALAGLPVTSAITALESRPGGPLGEAMQTAASRLARGATTAAVLAEIPDRAGSASRRLVEVLVDHDRYGTPLGPSLDRLAVESRLRRRRQAEEIARRLPVLLLFPLVLTTLPAFVLLTVVPLFVGSFSSLPL